MLERTFDVERAMAVLYDPSIWPHVSLGMERIDLSDAVTDPRNFVLMNEHGGFLFIQRADFIYEVHTMFRPAGRGKAAFLAAQDAAWYMFTQTDCLAITTFVTHDNAPARSLTLKMGFKEQGEAELNAHAGRIYMFTLKDWARRLSCQPQQ